MAEQITYENGWSSNLKGLVTLTLDRIIMHTVVHNSSTSTYMPNFIEIEEILWMDVCTYTRMYVRTDRHWRLALLLKWLVSHSQPGNESFSHCPHFGTLGKNRL